MKTNYRLVTTVYYSIWWWQSSSTNANKINAYPLWQEFI